MKNINDLMPLSPDHNQERLDALKKIMPDIFTDEGKLNINELKKVIDPDSVEETERYEFRWFGKSKAKREAFTPTDATLEYDELRSINADDTENIIIEGENLAVLKLLSSGYREKIKCIYIDPPYNTGKDFVYSDVWKQNKKEYWEETGYLDEDGFKTDTNPDTDGRFHSNWLNMMYSRLLIARQLLREDGVIFISIDDSEVHHLKYLCNAVFGEENFFEQIVWKNKTGGGAKTKGWIGLHEYILCYAKDKSLIDDISIPYSKKSAGMYNKKDEKFEERGYYATWPLDTTSMGDRPNLKFPIFHKGVEILPTQQWLWSQKRVEQAQKDNLLIFNPQSDGGYKVRFKGYIKDENGEMRRGKPLSILEGPYTQEGSKNFQEFLDKTYFPFPKPTKLIKELIQIKTSEKEENEIYLDFFGGSGTTAQAITELNKQDGGNRKYILVQLPEATDPKSEAHKAGYKKISDITIERNKRVIDKINTEKETNLQRIAVCQSEIKRIETEVGEEEKQNATLPMPGAGDSKAVAKLKKQITKLETEIDELAAGNEKIDALDKGFKVFKLVKSHFPRTEYAPEPDKTAEENVAALREYISVKEAQLYSPLNKDRLITEILIKNGFQLNITQAKQTEFKKNDIQLVSDGRKEALICLDYDIHDDTVEYFKKNKDRKLIVLERALDTTKKWNLKHYMGDKFIAF